MSQSKRLQPSRRNSGGDVHAAHGSGSPSVARQKQDGSTSTNFDDFDFDTLGTQFNGDVASAATQGVLGTAHDPSPRSIDDGGLNFLSTVKKAQREMRLEKMRSARKNRFSSLSLQSQESLRSVESGQRNRRSFFQGLSDRTPLLVCILIGRLLCSVSYHMIPQVSLKNHCLFTRLRRPRNERALWLSITKLLPKDQRRPELTVPTTRKN